MERIHPTGLLSSELGLLCVLSLKFELRIQIYRSIWLFDRGIAVNSIIAVKRPFSPKAKSHHLQLRVSIWIDAIFLSFSGHRRSETDMRDRVLRSSLAFIVNVEKLIFGTRGSFIPPRESNKLVCEEGRKNPGVFRTAGKEFQEDNEKVL
jgi:hypothetical protein